MMLTTKQAAQATGFSEKTLRNWRSLGKGPRFIRWGNTVRYRMRDIEAWMAEGFARSAA